MNATAVIAALGLQPLPHEGGFFRQTWRTPAGSAILYLMTPDAFSALHRLQSDEIWHFHAGDPVEQVQLDPRNGERRSGRLGPDISRGDVPQLVVPAGVWQGARLAIGRSDRSSEALAKKEDPPGFGWSLLGCTLAPPWDERAFELAAREDLRRTFPAHADVIRALTR